MSSYLPSLAPAETKWIQKMAINYCRSNQVVTPIEAAVARYSFVDKIVQLRPQVQECGH